MSIILEEIPQEGVFKIPGNVAEPGQPFVICKGADSFMFPLIVDL